jgi:hypothetical protein
MLSARDQQPRQLENDLLLRGLIEFALFKQSARAIERFAPPCFDLGHD